MIKKSIKNYIRGFFLLLLPMVLLVSQFLFLTHENKKIKLNNLSTNLVNKQQENKSTSFQLVDDDLIKQFYSLVLENNNYDRWFYYDTLMIEHEMYELYQTQPRNTFGWERTYTWELPIEFKLQFPIRIPVFRSDIKEAKLENYIKFEEEGEYHDNYYLQGWFEKDQYGDHATWTYPQKFDVRDFINSNLFYENNLNDASFGFGKVEVKTQDIQNTLQEDYINLASIKNFKYFDPSAEAKMSRIYSWDDNNSNCQIFKFSDLKNNVYLPLLYDSAFAAHFSWIWDAAIRNRVARKTLFLVNKKNLEKEFENAFPFINVDQLFQLGEIGYDQSTKQYWYNVKFNQVLLKGILGEYFNSWTNYIFNLDTKSYEEKVDLSNIYDLDFVKMIPKVFDGGQSSWVDKTKIPGISDKEYLEKIQNLISFLKKCIDKKELTYDNYFYVKNEINNFVANKHMFPPNEWIYTELTTNQAWQNNGWVDISNKYHLDYHSMYVVALLLPEIYYSQYHMFNTNGQDGDGWFNHMQDWNVGTDKKFNCKFSSFKDMVENKNKVWINPMNLAKDEPIKIMFNVGINETVQDSYFLLQDNYPLKKDWLSQGKYIPCNTENASAIEQLTNGNVKLKKGSMFTNKDGMSINNFDYYEIARDGQKIVKTINIPNTHLTVNNQLKSKLPSEVWSQATTQFPNDNVAALKTIFKDQNGLPASPFAYADIWTNKFISYDIPSNQLRVQVNDLTGSISISLVNTADTINVNGFKTSDQSSSDAGDLDGQDDNSGNDEISQNQIIATGPMSTKKIIIISSSCIGGISFLTLTSFWLFKKISHKLKSRNKSKK